MRELKKRFIIVCISFTLTTLFYTILGELGIANEINNQTVYDLLIINFIVSFVMFFTDKLPYKTTYSKIAVNIADIYIVVFLLGGIIFKMFPLKFYLITILSIVIILVYFIIFGVMFIKNQADAECINRKINAQRGKDHD